jgi:hypothetical protein
MQVELKKHIGMNFAGNLVEVGQWMVYSDGQHVAYLPYQVNSELLPIVGFSLDKMTFIVSECQRLRQEEDGLESIVTPPQEHNLRFLQTLELVKAQQEQDTETDDDD